VYFYPVVMEPDDNETVLVSFPDLPFVHTFGDDEDDALAHAIDALESGIMSLMEARKDIPAPSRPKRGQRTVGLPALSAAKVALYEAMRSAGVRKSDLARKMGLHLPQVDRLLDLRHSSRFDQLEAALRAVGKTIEIAVRDAA